MTPHTFLRKPFFFGVSLLCPCFSQTFSLSLLQDLPCSRKKACHWAWAWAVPTTRQKEPWLSSAPWLSPDSISATLVLLTLIPAAIWNLNTNTSLSGQTPCSAHSPLHWGDTAWPGLWSMFQRTQTQQKVKYPSYREACFIFISLFIFGICCVRLTGKFFKNHRIIRNNFLVAHKENRWGLAVQRGG